MTEADKKRSWRQRWTYYVDHAELPEEKETVQEMMGIEQNIIGEIKKRQLMLSAHVQKMNDYQTLLWIGYHQNLEREKDTENHGGSAECQKYHEEHCYYRQQWKKVMEIGQHGYTV